MMKLLKYIGKGKKQAIQTPIFVMLEVVAEILIPIFMGILIDDGAKMGEAKVIIKNGLIMIGLAIFALIFGVLASRSATLAANILGRNIRQAQYEHIQTFAFENIDRFSTSSLVTRLTMDVSMVQNATQMNIRVAFRSPAMMIFSIISAAIIGGPMALIFVSVIPILAFGLWIIMSNAHPYFLNMFKKIDRLNLTIQENLIGIRTVKSYVREEHEIERFKQASVDVSNNAKRAEKWVIFNNPLMQFSIFVCFLLISWFGSYRMVFHNFTEGQFANIITYVMQILFSLLMISQVFLMLVISKASVERILEVLNEETTLSEIDNPLTFVEDGSFIFKDVCFKYSKEEDKTILNNINLQIPSGSFVGIFGATGTGKSTLVQLLSRLYDVSRGEVLVGNHNVKDYAIKTIRQEVITVLQKNVLFSGTVRENIKWGKKDASDDEIISALKKAQAYDFVMNMPKGLDSWIEQGGVNVSGGQRQRLCIARALVSNPKILILDDSTSAVDTKTDALIRKSLRNDMPEMTKIVISQRLSSIEDADYIIILDNDGINAIGNHEVLIKDNDIYSGVYEAQQKGREVAT